VTLRKQYINESTGLTLYAKQLPLETGDWSVGITAFGENGSTGEYSAALDSSEWYFVYDQAGGSPDSGDAVVGTISPDEPAGGIEPTAQLFEQWTESVTGANLSAGAEIVSRTNGSSELIARLEVEVSGFEGDGQSQLTLLVDQDGDIAEFTTEVLSDDDDVQLIDLPSVRIRSGAVLSITLVSDNGSHTSIDVTATLYRVLTDADVRVEMDANSTIASAVETTNDTIDGITKGNVEISPVVAARGTINGPIIIGDDYLATHEKAFKWEVPALPGVAFGDATCFFGGKSVYLDTPNSWSVEGTVSEVDADTWELSFDLPKSATESLEPDVYDWSAEVRDAAANEVTRVRNTEDRYRVRLVEKQT
jgi:hypothetical protein